MSVSRVVEELNKLPDKDLIELRDEIYDRLLKSGVKSEDLITISVICQCLAIRGMRNK